MNKQEVFDKVAVHLLTQNRRSMKAVPWVGLDAVMTCAYRGDEALMCAAGCLIPDAMYHGGMENLTVYALQGEFMQAGVGPEALELLTELQRIHDAAAVSIWFTELQATALNFGLSDACLMEFTNANPHRA